MIELNNHRYLLSRLQAVSNNDEYQDFYNEFSNHFHLKTYLDKIEFLTQLSNFLMSSINDVGAVHFVRQIQRYLQAILAGNNPNDIMWVRSYVANDRAYLSGLQAWADETEQSWVFEPEPEPEPEVAPLPTPQEILDEEGGEELPTLTALRRATKLQLQTWCDQFGIEYSEDDINDVLMDKLRTYIQSTS